MAVGATLEELLRAAPSLAESLTGIDRAARSNAPILILGESGTGRSSLARALHLASPRRHGPLVEMDPGAVPSTLFESDLFGYRAGAFTGAERESIGRVARADGGTLVLDHVEELPLESQPKLLRVLAERRFTPLGGAERAADVRFIAIAAPDLAERTQRGAFRADLLYRLEVLAFELIPLRRRQEDLPTLLDAMLQDLALRQGRQMPTLSEQARGWMLEYSWPGNLRQLRNIIERALVITAGDQLDPAPPTSGVSRPRPLVELEEEHIRAALAYTHGHQGRAAELLGISRKALWQKRRRYGIP